MISKRSALAIVRRRISHLGRRANAHWNQHVIDDLQEREALQMLLATAVEAWGEQPPDPGSESAAELRDKIAKAEGKYSPMVARPEKLDRQIARWKAQLAAMPNV